MHTDDKSISDYQLFENAIANGNFDLAEKILKNLDPEGLKETKNAKSNLQIMEHLLEKAKKEIGEKNSADLASLPNVISATTCERLELAVLNRNNHQVRTILKNENLTCLNDIYGEPSTEISLLKGLLRYDANLYIDENGVIHISDIGFVIDAKHQDSDMCDDPHFAKLSDAIRSKDERKIRRILSTEVLTCPLSVDGVTNDFIFIKELMNYRPEIINRNGKSITVYGIGIEIDLYKKADKLEKHGITMRREQSTIDNQEISIEQASCTELIQSVISNDYIYTAKLLDVLNPNCSHKETHTTTSPDENTSYSEVTTPLIAAARQGNHTIAKLLLKAKF